MKRWLLLLAVAAAGSLLWPSTGTAATDVPSLAITGAKRMGDRIKVVVHVPTTGRLVVRDGQDSVKKKGIIDKIHASNATFATGPTVFLVKLTPSARGLLADKGRCKVVMEAVLVPDDGSAPMTAAESVVIRRGG